MFMIGQAMSIVTCHFPAAAFSWIIRFFTQFSQLYLCNPSGGLPWNTWNLRATQNRNEAWNGMLWGLWPKTKFGGADVVRLCAALTSMRFNHGMCMYGAVLEEMGIQRGVFTSRALQLEDNNRLRIANRKASEKSKRARKRRRVRKGLEDEIQQAEGVVNAPGTAD